MRHDHDLPLSPSPYHCNPHCNHHRNHLTYHSKSRRRAWHRPHQQGTPRSALTTLVLWVGQGSRGTFFQIFSNIIVFFYTVCRPFCHLHHLHTPFLLLSSCVIIALIKMTRSVEEPSSQTTDKEELSPSVGVRVVESGAKEENMKT